MNHKEFLYSCSKTKVLLIGDIMLDRYVIGNVNRISPEAPVPIFLSEKSKQVLGGAGNVYNNLVDCFFFNITNGCKSKKKVFSPS